jgi:hypothetical protein
LDNPPFSLNLFQNDRFNFFDVPPHGQFRLDRIVPPDGIQDPAMASE